MIIHLSHDGKEYACDLSLPHDISISVGRVRCFYAPPYGEEAFTSDDFIGDVSRGGSVNFFNVHFNPHGHGTHTESAGHLTTTQESVGRCLMRYHFMAQLISLETSKLENGDAVIGPADLATKLTGSTPDALIIRTLPNTIEKCTRDYSGTNPPYLSQETMKLIVDLGVRHLLIDLPSVDREEDEGKLVNHRLFWNLPEKEILPESRKQCTITELVYIPNDLPDGWYLLNLQLSAFELDAAPSKPVLYPLLQL